MTSAQPAHEALPVSAPFARREGLRLMGALAALLAAALLATGGLIWREHARAHGPAARPAPASLR